MIYTRYIPGLPMSVHGFVIKDSNDDYTIILNPAMTHNMQLKTAKHEIEHISYDYYQELDVDSCESIRHK